MTSHELARHLLNGPDLPIATYANGHAAVPHTPSLMKVGVLESYMGQHVIIGNMSARNLNKPNEYISEMLVGELPEERRERPLWANG